MVVVKFKKLDPTAIPFSYTREDDACMDMYAFENKVVEPHTSCIIPTGIAVEIPKGYEGIVRGRSGINSKGYRVAIGTIDESYRGDVGIIINNCTDKVITIAKGMRLAQFTIKPVYRISMVEGDLSNTERGTKGFGSSGV